MLDQILRTIFPLIAVLIGLIFTATVFSLFRWIIWLVISLFLAFIQISFGAYQMMRIILDLVILFVVKVVILFTKLLRNLTITSEIGKMRRRLWHVSTYREWSALASEIDHLDGTDAWRDSLEGFPSAEKLAVTITTLRELRKRGDLKSLLFELPAYIKRNHLGIDDASLFASCYTGTKRIIEEYVDEIRACIGYISELKEEELPLADRIAFVGKLSKNLGQTALCLSGGGSLSMYHMGVIRALIESGNYQHVRNELKYSHVMIIGFIYNIYIHHIDSRCFRHIRRIDLRCHVRLYARLEINGRSSD
jgi:hypothetical protein